MYINNQKRHKEPFERVSPTMTQISVHYMRDEAGCDPMPLMDSVARTAWWSLAVKRGIDLVIAASAIIALMPFMLAIAALIRLESRGPALFTQVRWGKDGGRINVYKFRSMYLERCDLSGVTQTVAGDPRITRVGRVIRRMNVDELPQLFNVLRGDMSLVGPRCHAIGMLAAGVPYEQLVPNYHRRHRMRPGMTGLAQMRGLRGPTDRPSKARARIAADLFYVDNFSIWLDMKIMAGTVYAELRNARGF